MNDIEYLDYWNKLYDSKFYFGTGPTKLAKKAESLLVESKVKRILELGCGQGRDAIHFAQLGYDVNAVDISQNAIESIKKIKTDLDLTTLQPQIHDIAKPLPFSEESFDFIYSNLALQFFDINQLEQNFQNISKILKKDSFFLFSTKKIGDKYYKFGTKVSENAYENKGIIRYFYDSETLTNVLSKNFEILELEADEHMNLDQTKSVWWKILVKKKN
jgi:SAM-dependent methyltransferase